MRVNGDPLRVIQEGLEGFLHSLSENMDSRKRMLLPFAENLSNSSLQIATTQCDDAYLLCLVVRFVHFLTGDRAVINVCACAKGIFLLHTLGYIEHQALFYRHSLVTQLHKHPETCSWQEPGTDNESKRGSIKTDSRRS